MMIRRRKLLFLSLFLVFATLIGIVIYQRVARPARAMLLLPDGNLLLYVNFAPAHFFDLGQMPIQTDPQYQEFVRQTGFHFEHDLNTIAVSQRNPGETNSESSAVFTGVFNQDRIGHYLQKLASSSEEYGGRTIYSIPEGGHTVRACLLDSKTVAVTNMDSSDPMHLIVDRSRSVLLSGGASSLVKDYYDNVPFASLAWAMVRVPAKSSSGQLPGGISAEFLANSVSVVSLRYTGSIRLKAEVISASTADASNVLEAANTLRVLAKGAGESLSAGGTDKDVKAVFDNIQVQQSGNRTVLSVAIPQAFVQKMAARMNH